MFRIFFVTFLLLLNTNLFSQDFRHRTDYKDVYSYIESKYYNEFLEKSQFETQEDYKNRIDDWDIFNEFIEDAINDCKNACSEPYFIKEKISYNPEKEVFILDGDISFPFAKATAEFFYNSLYNKTRTTNLHILVIPKEVILIDNKIRILSAQIIFDLYQTNQITSDLKSTFGILAYLDCKSINTQNNTCLVAKNRTLNIYAGSRNKNVKDQLVRLPINNLENITFSSTGKVKEGLYYLQWKNNTWSKNMEQTVEEAAEFFALTLDDDQDRAAVSISINARVNDLFGNGRRSNEAQGVGAFSNSSEVAQKDGEKRSRRTIMLRKPQFDGNASGSVIVDMVVDPNGDVIDVSVNSKTKVSKKEAIRATIEAARKAKFEKINSTENEKITITYNFSAN